MSLRKEVLGRPKRLNEKSIAAILAALYIGVIASAVVASHLERGSIEPQPCEHVFTVKDLVKEFVRDMEDQDSLVDEPTYTGTNSITGSSTSPTIIVTPDTSWVTFSPTTVVKGTWSP